MIDSMQKHDEMIQLNDSNEFKETNDAYRNAQMYHQTVNGTRLNLSLLLVKFWSDMYNIVNYAHIHVYMK